MLYPMRRREDLGHRSDTAVQITFHAVPVRCRSDRRMAVVPSLPERIDFHRRVTAVCSVSVPGGAVMKTLNGLDLDVRRRRAVKNAWPIACAVGLSTVSLGGQALDDDSRYSTTVSESLRSPASFSQLCIQANFTPSRTGAILPRRSNVHALLETFQTLSSPRQRPDIDAQRWLLRRPREASKLHTHISPST